MSDDFCLENISELKNECNARLLEESNKAWERYKCVNGKHAIVFGDISVTFNGNEATISREAKICLITNEEHNTDAYKVLVPGIIVSITKKIKSE